MTGCNRKILVVDGYSTGKRIVDIAASKGYVCYHMQSGSEKDVPADYIKENMAEGYAGHLKQLATCEQTADMLAPYRFDAVIPGTESGVITAERLSELLKLPCNDMSKWKARRDKYYMQKQLEADGIPCIPTIKTADEQEALSWFDLCGQKPVVVKARMSAGGINVFICRTKEEISSAFKKLLDQPSCFGDKTYSVLVQQFMTGQEIAVNTVSHNGHHAVTELWAYDVREPVLFGLGMQRTMTPDFEAAVQYVYRVLDSLGIRYGAGHSEVMLTENGPVLIEAGARIMGTEACQELNEEAFGYMNVSLLIDSYFTEQGITSLQAAGYHPLKSMYIKYLFSSEEAHLRSIPLLDLLPYLPQVRKTELDELQRTMQIHKTENMVTSPGTLILIDEDDGRLKKCVRLLEKIEQEMPRLFFEKDNDRPMNRQECQMVQDIKKNRWI